MTAASPSDPHAALRDDVRLLGTLLGDTLRARAGDDLFRQIERVRALAKSAHEGDRSGFDRLANLLRELPLGAAVPIARAFSHFLALANIAEQHHRVRRRREYARAGRTPQPGSCEEAFPRLLAAGVTSRALTAAVGALRIELVLTAHPTEIARRTVLQAQHRIADTLALRDRTDLTAVEQEDAIDTLRREIAILWETEEGRDRPVSPLDEVRAGLVVFEQTLWDAVPRYLRALDRALHAATGDSLPLDATPIRFGSWIGGDRDGNPNVTPDVTRQATWLARWMAADLYAREIKALRVELSLTDASDELRARVPRAPEPYRALLRELVLRLAATLHWARAQLDGPHDRPVGFDPAPYLDVADFLEPLDLCYRSLVGTGNRLIADGRLTDILRRVAVFGLTLAPLDLRQESSRHAQAIAWVAAVRRLGAYADADEPSRVALLTSLLEHAPSPIADEELANAPDSVRDVFDTVRMAAALHPDSLGAYVVTMTHQASDVLAVELLQRLAGNRRPQRVVPLLETADDLRRAGLVLDDLLAIPWYRQRVRDHGETRGGPGSRLEVMVGYSDSAKDAGRFAAAWALYRAQEEIVARCHAHGVAVTLFHGRGGSIGRGGGPTYLAIQSQPPGSVDGTLRVTEQGEMIQAKFGLVDIAVRTLEVYTTATLEAVLTPAADPDPSWRGAMDRLFDEARTAYRAVVHENPRFVDYFRTATPEPELRTISIGSRPARRAVGGGVESLRAIPWQFAWTQTRLLLASWLGTEAALESAFTRGEGECLRTMYARWPFFRSTLDVIEMVLAKADGRIAGEYDRRLVPRDLTPLGHDLRARLARAIDAVLHVTGHRELVETNRVLRRSIDTRNPYVDPINLVQIELLNRLRQSPESQELRRAFVITVNGIAAGMRNTG
ncbi:MAG TPA: phosphoenolpyruvate carboxylase [Vicinamibacterales bacterium]|nr:phosphoenolpyruvate carboxylase [Vicinamibacterales bacterium]